MPSRYRTRISRMCKVQPPHVGGRTTLRREGVCRIRPFWLVLLRDPPTPSSHTSNEVWESVGRSRRSDPRRGVYAIGVFDSFLTQAMYMAATLKSWVKYLSGSHARLGAGNIVVSSG